MTLSESGSPWIGGVRSAVENVDRFALRLQVAGPLWCDAELAGVYRGGTTRSKALHRHYSERRT